MNEDAPYITLKEVADRLGMRGVTAALRKRVQSGLLPFDDSSPVVMQLKPGTTWLVKDTKENIEACRPLRKRGRPRNESVRAQVRALDAKGLSVCEIARKLYIAHQWVSSILKERKP